MRIWIFILLIFFNTTGLRCQTLQGYVKTQGRPNKPGKALAGVTIRWRGAMNAVVSAADGRFKAPFPGKKDGDAIYLLNVKKNDYELIDPELTNRPLTFSTSVPIEIVMASSLELEANRKRISDNAYRKAEVRYQTKIKELEKQLKKEEVTIEQYRKQLQELQDYYERYVSLIEGMADRYARTDYDHLDVIDQEINICIENGDLDKADSLIHSVFDPSTVLERNRITKANIEDHRRFAQEIIDKANAGIEEIRQDSLKAIRIMVLCDDLAEEYLSQGKVKEAIKNLEQSLSIRIVLYGEKSESVRIVKEKIGKLK